MLFKNNVSIGQTTHRNFIFYFSQNEKMKKLNQIKQRSQDFICIQMHKSNDS
jgi:hypothetical protein